MGSSGICLIPSFVIVLCCIQAHLLNSQNLTCSSKDLISLRGLLEGLDSSVLDWDQDSADCCRWLGIKCMSSFALGLNESGATDLGQRIVQLNLSNTGLKGILPKYLGGLDQLRILNLSSNSLSGALPPDLFQLHNLEVLDLSRNVFSESFPSIVNLPSIQVFNISSNSFTGSQPILVGSRNLTSFVISHNLFSGPINSSICESSPLLQVLDLSSNNFIGKIPIGFRKCESLTDVLLHSNNLSGNLPEDLYELSSVMRLQLHKNRLSGDLNPMVQNLSNLVHLDISNNSFSGAIPEIFTNLRKLEYFSAGSNYFTGSLPASVTSSTSLLHLDLRSNLLNGSIDLNCSELVVLRYLDLASNQFIGPIPDNLSVCSKLEIINLGKNNLKGLVPSSLKNLQALSYLSLSHNALFNISRALEILQHCSNLSTLVLASNFYGEAMPGDQIQEFSSLRVFSMPNCNVSGKIPSWLSNSTMLKVLDLSRNHLTGTIPAWLGSLLDLTYLDLSDNFLAGEIPLNLTEISSLIQENSPLIARFQKTEELMFNEFFTLPPSIKLRGNRLSGNILPEFGQLKLIHILDLSSNCLSGAIPQNLSGMENLEILDLSNNSLTGRIPNSLTKLSFMSLFNVANNHLEGPIPDGGQFSTYDKTQFEGNSGLCGMYFLPCGQPQAPSSATPGKQVKKSGISSVGLPFGLGAAVGFLLTITVCFMRGFYSKGKGFGGKLNSLRTFSPITANDNTHDDCPNVESGSTVLSQETIWNWPVPASSKTICFVMFTWMSTPNVKGFFCVKACRVSLFLFECEISDVHEFASDQICQYLNPRSMRCFNSTSDLILCLQGKTGGYDEWTRYLLSSPTSKRLKTAPYSIYENIQKTCLAIIGVCDFEKPASEQRIGGKD
ncbi:hypothetical protein H6P81_018210 [Aristolochia fimbriata]|uniref:Leucine-rich repeat-containing N-terminal plant-type domain-containing protein n=1 Tax=Aristolochia fimbriata TaxID=158543 RepID=A0AAV7E1V6_ARIFI|nr:hypothetical protein H6P81_018210 [Aristolochia fimbriata]